MMLSIISPSQPDHNGNIILFPKENGVLSPPLSPTSTSPSDFNPDTQNLVLHHHHHRPTKPSPVRGVDESSNDSLQEEEPSLPSTPPDSPGSAHQDESSNDSVSSLHEGEEEPSMPSTPPNSPPPSAADPDESSNSSSLQEGEEGTVPSVLSESDAYFDETANEVSESTSHFGEAYLRLHYPEPMPIPNLSVVKSSPRKRQNPSGAQMTSNIKQTRTDPRILPSGCQGVKYLGGKFLLFDQVDGGSLHKCIEVETKKELICKVLPLHTSGHTLLSAHFRVEGSPNINPIKEVVLGNRRAYIMFNKFSTDLHSYVRSKRRLKEPQARHLFRQIVMAVKEAHVKGIVLRDLKLRKFIFTSDSRLELKLESLEDAVVLDDSRDDWLSDKHGCPAYVSPEILKCNTRYSGRAADMWGLGVMLYTMLVGRYPFHGQEHSGLFAKIRRGHFSLPDTLSSRAKCLIRCLLRKEPEERLNTEEVLSHPWLTHQSSRERTKRVAATSGLFSNPGAAANECADQKVPEASNAGSLLRPPPPKKVKTE